MALATFMLASRRYLEWGSGGSTVLAAWRSLQRNVSRFVVHSVENSWEYFRALKQQHTVVHKAIEAGFLTHTIPHLGTTGQWGRPTNWSALDVATRRARSHAYYSPAGVVCCFDTILIDGRFRQACLLQALHLSHDHTLVLLHDNVVDKERDYRPAVRKWYDHLAQHGTLSVLRPKQRSILAARVKSLELISDTVAVSDEFM